MQLNGNGDLSVAWQRRMDGPVTVFCSGRARAAEGRTQAMGTGKSVAALEMSRIFNEHCGTQGVMWLLPATASASKTPQTRTSKPVS